MGARGLGLGGGGPRGLAPSTLRRMSPPLPRPVHPNPTAAMALLWVAVSLTVPGLLMTLLGFHPHTAPILGLAVYGTGIVAAAFLLTWAAEVAEAELGSGLAVVFLALVTVLPEYAVDMNLAWSAATEPARRAEALANMTGANRLLIGIGWPIVALLSWYREGRRAVDLDRSRSGDVVWLGIATLYSLVIPFKGTIAWYDAAILFFIYGLYVRGSARSCAADGEGCGHDLVGPPVVMSTWSRSRRMRWTTGLFLWSAGAILASSEPFVVSLEHGGDKLGVPRTMMIQWLAPLASEAPEFVVVILLTLRGRAALGLGAFISSKVNQWTLLVGGIPIAYGLSCLYHGQGFAPSMLIDDHQVEELLLTCAQGLYATAAIADLRFSLGQALAILGLFLVQFVGSLLLARFGGTEHLAAFHNVLSGVYAVLALERIVTQRHDVRQRLRDEFVGVPPAPATITPPAVRGGAGSPDESDA